MAATNISSTSPKQKLQRRGRGRRIEAYAYFEENKKFGMLSEKDPRSVKIKHAAFFQKPKWWEDLKSIDISAAGQKGGVIFIHTNIPGRGYAIKVTDAPQQVKFAEHLLSTLGKAKIPKSIILSVKDDSVVNSTTNLLMNFIKERGKKNDIPPRVKYHLEAKEVKGVLPETIEALEKKQESTVFVGKYNNKYYIRIFQKGSILVDRQEIEPSSFSSEIIQNLEAIISKEKRIQGFDYDKLTQDIMDTMELLANSGYEFQSKKRLSYEKFLKEFENESNFLVVMKLIQGEPLSDISADLNSWTKKYYPDSVSNVREIDRIINTIKFGKNGSKSLYCKNKEIKGDSYKALMKIIGSIYINKSILANQQFMQNLGRILAVDSLLGNQDRFEKMNLGNAFFLKRNYSDKSKTKNPIAVIDNDSILPIFLGRDKLHKNISMKNDVISTYIMWNISLGYNLAKNTDQIARIKFLIEKFDPGWFKNVFFTSFFIKVKPKDVWIDKYPIIKEIYLDDGSLIGKPKVYQKISSDFKDEFWSMVKKNIIVGFDDILNKIRKKDIFFDSFKITSEYNKLSDEYGFTDDFDLIALDVRRCYMAQAFVKYSGKNIKIEFDHTKAIEVVKKECFPVVKIPDFINNSIQYCISQGLESGSSGDQLAKRLINGDFSSKNLFKILPDVNTYLQKQLQENFIKGGDYRYFRFLCTYAFLKIFDADEVIFKSHLAPKVRIELFSSKVRFWSDRLCWVFKNSKKMSKAVSSVLKEFAEASHVNDVDLYHKLSKDALYNAVHKTVEN
ncbi:hypothetical protein [Adonisia turfae]|uniref:Uncharacterized protein n=1 Tax=Adonisia turfae CCMR0081 TaxID=2292702 RepID=A0A6M0RQR1_9CYAN|nr:hypothetical protein [Adonisia turfae]NEZ58072.1 hypothetical protein [Adonisia turfae CCMR0081]